MQGTAADLIKLSMIAVDAWLQQQSLYSRLIMQVHDELVLEVPETELELVRQQVPILMSQAASQAGHAMSVPLLAEVGVGANWEAAH
jgi:DNA polymerase-1